MRLAAAGRVATRTGDRTVRNVHFTGYGSGPSTLASRRSATVAEVRTPAGLDWQITEGRRCTARSGVKADAQRRGLSFSAWVEGAIRRRLAREIAADLVAEYEAEHGPIPEKLRVQARREMGLPPRTAQQATPAKQAASGKRASRPAKAS